MCVKADGTIVGKHRPSSEYPFHRAIYKIRPKMRAVIHAHPPGLVTFIVIHPSIIPQARAVCGPIGFAKYDVPGSGALGKSIAEEPCVSLLSIQWEQRKLRLHVGMRICLLQSIPSRRRGLSFCPYQSLRPAFLG